MAREKRIVSATDVRTTYTPAEYLELERAAETKSEYRYGQIYAMTGASRAHNLISGNLFGELRQQLRGRSCEAYVNDIRVRVSHTGLYTYPDVVVACGEIEFEDDSVDTLLNPVILIEVLSPSTEAYDRGEKFAHFRRLESLQEYILVSQNQIRVERYVRRGEQWMLTELSAPDDVLEIAAIECGIRMADIYERVNLPSAAPSLTAADAGENSAHGDSAGEG
jgi:Uma2 family endonuclease